MKVYTLLSYKSVQLSHPQKCILLQTTKTEPFIRPIYQRISYTKTNTDHSSSFRFPEKYIIVFNYALHQ